MQQNRVAIFNELSLNDLKEFDVTKAENLIGDYYDQFSSFCDFLQNGIGEVSDSNGNKTSLVKSVSCEIDKSGVEFTMIMADGSSKNVFMSKEREKEFEEQRKKELNK